MRPFHPNARARNGDLKAQVCFAVIDRRYSGIGRAYENERQTRAGRNANARFASLHGDLLDSLCGDFITEDLGRVLASVCGGELAGIQSLIENEDTDEWVAHEVLRTGTGFKRKRRIAPLPVPSVSGKPHST